MRGGILELNISRLLLSGTVQLISLSRALYEDSRLLFLSLEPQIFWQNPLIYATRPSWLPLMWGRPIKGCQQISTSGRFWYWWASCWTCLWRGCLSGNGQGAQEFEVGWAFCIAKTSHLRCWGRAWWDHQTWLLSSSSRRPRKFLVDCTRREPHGRCWLPAESCQSAEPALPAYRTCPRTFLTPKWLASGYQQS